MVTITEIVEEILNFTSHFYALSDIREFGREIGFDFDPIADKLTPLIELISSTINTIKSLNNSCLDVLNLEDPMGSDLLETLENFIKILYSIFDLIKNIKNLASNFLNYDFNEYLSDLLESDDFHDFPKVFFERTFGWIIFKYLTKNKPELFDLLSIIGIIKSIYHTVDDEDIQKNRVEFIEYKIHWDKIGETIKDPIKTLKNLYKWGTGEQNINMLLDYLQNFLLTQMVATELSEITATTLTHFEELVEGNFNIDDYYQNYLRITILEDEISGFRLEGQLIPLPTTTEIDYSGLGIALIASFEGAKEISLSRDITLKLDGGIDLQAAIYIALMPGKAPRFSFQLPSPNITRASIQLIRKGQVLSEPTLIIGNPEGNRFEIGNLDFLIGIDIYKDQNPEIYGEAHINNGKIILNLGEGDGFIQKILPLVNIESNFDLTFGFSTLRGVYFRGSATLEIVIPIHKELGPINLDSIYLSISTPDTGVIPIIIAVSFSAKLGPISATVKNIGLKADLSFPEEGGNLGPVNLDLGFKWPTGVGLSINTSGLTGGGYLEFDPDNGRYVGVLQLTFSEIGLVAITLITTKMPDGSKGFSMLSLINVTFDPAISLPYNFKLHGVGGLLGIQRTMKTDVIRDGLKTGMLDSVMFPEGDIIQRAPQIISDLRTIFPPTEDRYIIGLMAKLSWSELIYGDIGLFIEIPMPIKIALLGQLYTYLPSEEAPIVEVHLDFIGALDLEQKKLYFMASIYDSRILIIDLYGDAYIGVSWGSKPYFVLSLGGFHPRDKTIPPDIPSLRRLTLSLGSGNNPRITLKTYLALTSTSLGFGARLDLIAKAGKFSAEGYMGFDALIIFSPFSFEVDMGAGVAIKLGGTTLLSVSLDLLLSGPTPWHAKGVAKFKILFFEIKVKVSATWGSKNKATLPTLNPWIPLKQALEHNKSWGTATINNRPLGIQIKQNEGSDQDVLIYPTGYLEIRQNVLPLDIRITKFRNAAPSGDNDEFSISQVDIGGSLLEKEATLDYFSRPQYQEMSDSEKLSSPAYEKLNSGVRCKADGIKDDVISSQIDYILKYETEVIDENKMAQKLERSGNNWTIGKYMLKAGVANSFKASKYGIPLVKPVAELKEEAYSIVRNENLEELSGDSIPNNGALTYVRALQEMETYLINHPEHVGQLQIVPKCEVASCE